MANSREDFNLLLKKYNACTDAINWSDCKTIEQVVADCHRGDWLLWLARRIDIDLRSLTLAKGYCARTVLHLMVDQRSIDAVHAAIEFGSNTLQTIDSNVILNARAAVDSCAATYAAYAAVCPPDSITACAAAYAAYAYTKASSKSVAYDAAYYEAKNQLKTADICREYIGALIIDKVNKLMKLSNNNGE